MAQTIFLLLVSSIALAASGAFEAPMRAIAAVVALGVTGTLVFLHPQPSLLGATARFITPHFTAACAVRVWTPEAGLYDTKVVVVAILTLVLAHGPWFSRFFADRSDTT